MTTTTRPAPAAQRRTGSDDRHPRARPAADHRAAGRDLGPPVEPGLATQARQRYGDTTQWLQYAERSAPRGPKEWQAIADAIAVLGRGLGDAMDAGVTPGGPEANQVAEWHRKSLLRTFPSPGRCRSVSATCMRPIRYLPAHYDGIRAGLATWFRRIIDANARPRHRPRHRDLAVERGPGSLHPWGRPTPSRTRKFSCLNARLTPCGRRLIIERSHAGWKQAHISAGMGVSRRCAGMRARIAGPGGGSRCCRCTSRSRS